MKRELLLGLLASLTVASCATTEFTPGGRTVRTISPVIAQNCEHLGMSSSWKPVIEGGLSAAQIDIRNKVAARGGNAMLVVSQQVDPPPYQHAQIMAEAYRCEFRKPGQ